MRSSPALITAAACLFAPLPPDAGTRRGAGALLAPPAAMRPSLDEARAGRSQGRISGSSGAASLARSSPQRGFLSETSSGPAAGGVLLLLAAALGLFPLPRPDRPALQQGAGRSPIAAIRIRSRTPFMAKFLRTPRSYKISKRTYVNIRAPHEPCTIPRKLRLRIPLESIGINGKSKHCSES